jgi:P4 family phage/plasmid primase-like protien
MADATGGTGNAAGAHAAGTPPPTGPALSGGVRAGAPPSPSPSPSLHHFLLGCRVEKGADHTHTSFAKPAGAFYVQASQAAEFNRLYAEALVRGDDLHITEKHRHVAPFVVDLDFRFAARPDELPPPKGQAQAAAAAANAAAVAPARRYTDEHVSAVALLYARTVASWLETPAAFDVYVMEKPAPVLFKGLVKDGVHLVVPGVAARAAVRHLVRDDVLAGLPAALKGLRLENRMEDVLDEAVVERNNWLMHGSKKPGGVPYQVTRVLRYRSAADRLEPAAGPAEPQGVQEAQALVELLSVRNKLSEAAVRPDRVAAVEAWQAAQAERLQRREAVKKLIGETSNPRTNTCDNLDQVCRLVDILSPARADSYVDWIQLGWCLRNVDHRLLARWDEFSRASPKHIEGECERLWGHMRQGGLGLGTLHMWARQDSPDAYREAIRTDLLSLITAARSGTHTDVARVVHHLYRYEFVCAGLASSRWYEFRDHRWRASEQAHSLRKRFSNEVFREFFNCAVAYQQRARTADDESDQARFNETGARLLEVATRLKTTVYKDYVLKECAELFYEEKFDEHLDAGTSIICFENGVFDLEAHVFREGRPDDYVSLSTGVNYVPFCEDAPAVRELRRFFAQVHADPAVREYVLLTMGAFINGYTREERFHIWTGSGSNGKSLCVSLFEAAFGEYCCKFPIMLLTGKRAASNAATSELAVAKGKRLAVLQEPGDNEVLNVGLMKEISGGDKIQCRKIYQAPIEFLPQWSLLLCCNHLPHVPSDDGGTWRRIRVVEFGSRFCTNPDPKRANEFPIDTELGRKLDTWKEHFASLVIEYHRRYAACRHLEEPEAVLRVTRDYQRNSDFYADYADTRLARVQEGTAFLCVNDVFQDFKDWVRDDNIPIKVPKKKTVQLALDKIIGRHATVGLRVGWTGWTLQQSDDGGRAGSWPGAADDGL